MARPGKKKRTALFVVEIILFVISVIATVLWIEHLCYMFFFVIYSSILHSQIQQHYNGHDHVLQMSRTAR